MLFKHSQRSGGNAPSILVACMRIQPQHVRRDRPFFNAKQPTVMGDPADTPDPLNNTGSARAASYPPVMMDANVVNHGRVWGHPPACYWNLKASIGSLISVTGCSGMLGTSPFTVAAMTWPDTP